MEGKAGADCNASQSAAVFSIKGTLRNFITMIYPGVDPRMGSIHLRRF